MKGSLLKKGGKSTGKALDWFLRRASPSCRSKHTVILWHKNTECYTHMSKNFTATSTEKSLKYSPFVALSDIIRSLPEKHESRQASRQPPHRVPVLTAWLPPSQTNTTSSSAAAATSLHRAPVTAGRPQEGRFPNRGPGTTKTALKGASKQGRV